MRDSATMKHALLLALVLLGCADKSSEETSSKDEAPSSSSTPKKKKRATAPASAAAAAATASAVATASAAAPAPTEAADASFFAGEVPASVKLKPIKAAAMDDNALVFRVVDGWSGGKLPGNDYMAMSKDQSAVFRLDTSSAVVAGLGCKEIASALAMAPAKIKDVTEVSAPKLAKVGANGFVAKEGRCAGEGPKGPVDIHFLDVNRKSGDDSWHYAILVSFPKDAPQELKDEVLVYARSLEFTGRNAYSMP